MRFSLIPAALVVAVLGTAAFADEVTGVVTSVDTAAMMLVLDTGAEIVLPEGFSDEAVVAGAKVVVVYDETDGKMVATDVKLAE